MTEEYTPPYTSTPLANDPHTVPVAGTTPPVVGYSTPPTTGATQSGSEGGTADVAKGQAAEVAQGAKEAGQHVAGVAKEQAANVGAEAGRQAKDLLAQGIRSISDELQKMTQPGQTPYGPATDLAKQGAQRAQAFASWLEQREPTDLLDEVKTFARQRPGMFLLLAAGAGLVAGRMTRGLKEVASDQAEAQQAGSYSEYGTPTQYGTGVQYGAGTQYGTGAQYGVETGTPVVVGVVEEVEVVRPYASSEDGPTGFPTTGGTTGAGGTVGGTR